MTIEPEVVQHDRQIPRKDAQENDIEYWVIHDTDAKKAMAQFYERPWLDYVLRIFWLEPKKQLWVPVGRDWRGRKDDNFPG